MKFFALTLTSILASLVSAVPTESHAERCTPGTYSCTQDCAGWRVCDVSSIWVYAGACPPKTSCQFNEENQSPYCI